MILDKQNIKVLSYVPTYLCVSTRDRGVGFEASNGITPSVDFFSFAELEQINSHSPVFRTGMLEFEPELQVEIYDALHIPNWQDTCLFERDIPGMILAPDMKSMKRIVAIKDIQTLDRVRGCMRQMIASGQDVSVKVKDAVDTRFREITDGVLVTKILIEPKSSEPRAASADEVEALKAQVAAMATALAGAKTIVHEESAVTKAPSAPGKAAGGAVKENPPTPAPAAAKKAGGAQKTGSKTPATGKRPVGRPTGSKKEIVK